MTTSSASAAPVVPVQLTTITPVRVFNVHGEFFDTEVDVDAPLRPLQLAIEDYFLAKAELQLLLHNRQQINPQLSLRQNGCLMLKGDPYVKLVFAIKRGTVLNVICHVRGGQRVRGGFSFPLACDESLTVWEAKRAIADSLLRRTRRLEQNNSTGATGAAEAAEEGDAPLNPHRLRLMWRYMELNDKATLHYYRVPTNAEMHVRFRHGPVPAYTPATRVAAGASSSEAVAQSLAHIPPQHFNDAVRVGLPHTAVTAAADVVTPLSAWQQQQEDARVQQQQQQRQQFGPSAQPPLWWQQQEPPQSRDPPPQAPTTSSSSALPPPSSSSCAAALPTRPVVCDIRQYAPAPPHDAPLQVLSDSANATVVEVSALRRQTQWVSAELESLKQQYHTQHAQLQLNTSLRQELEQRSAQRIAELEASMQHFQQYLERALRLIAAETQS